MFNIEILESQNSLKVFERNKPKQDKQNRLWSSMPIHMCLYNINEKDYHVYFSFTTKHQLKSETLFKDAFSFNLIKK